MSCTYMYSHKWCQQWLNDNNLKARKHEDISMLHCWLWNLLWFCSLRLPFINWRFRCYSNFDIPSLSAYGTQSIVCKIMCTFAMNNFGTFCELVCISKWKVNCLYACYTCKCAMYVLSYCKSQRLKPHNFYMQHLSPLCRISSLNSRYTVYRLLGELHTVIASSPFSVFRNT